MRGVRWAGRKPQRDADERAPVDLGTVALRHVLAHRSGVVDQQYVDETGDTSIPVGRRLVIDPNAVLALTDAIARIGNVLLSILPPAK